MSTIGAIGDFVERSTATDHTYPTINKPVQYDHDMELKIKEMERAQQQAQQEILIKKLLDQVEAAQKTPFEETEDFRDYIVWLCGFTDRSEPPSQEDWDGLKERTKQVAAKFALQARDRAKKELQERAKEREYERQAKAQQKMYQQQPLFGGGIAGDQVLTGAEDMLAGQVQTISDTAAYSALSAGTKAKLSGS